MKKLSALFLLSLAVVTPAEALTLKAMKQPGSAIVWRDTDRDQRVRDLEEFVMNVEVPTGDIVFANMETCMQAKLVSYKDLKPLDKKGPSFHELMSECVF